MSIKIPFTKMVGAGNDFIVVDTRRSARLRALGRQWPSISRALCDRHQGVGADGLLVLEPSARAAAWMRVFNPDGSEARMCGNGARCVAVYLKGSGQWVTVETRAGVLSAKVSGDRVALRMTDPTRLKVGQSLAVDGRRIRYGFVDTGVPHVVVPVGRLEAVKVGRLGRAIRNHPRFAPGGANVDFIQPDGRHARRLRIRTYERGVEAETLACGTGVAAAALIHALGGGSRPGGQRQLEVATRSGDVMRVSFRLASNGSAPQAADLVLEGAARSVFRGAIQWPMKGRR